MEINFSPDNLKELANLVAPLLSINQPDQDWVKLEDIRADLFAGKAKSWIRLYIFDQFPEVQIENGDPKAWVVGAHGTGKVTKIYLPYARKWMHEHHDVINWTAKMP
ncbi:hypothetical protein ACLOBK_03480 [Limosilactobacillus fermentum]|uniref:hypothetical protein n=1 Tax=Limosilactobacillus fermentum TaxID=1613 RepID=UPI003EBD76C7